MKPQLLGAFLALTGCGPTPVDPSQVMISHDMSATEMADVANGVDVARKSTVLLHRNDRPSCTGVLVRPDTVLSAAHCFRSSASPADFAVSFQGEIRQTRRVLDITLPHTRNGAAELRSLPRDDIAIVRLSGESFREAQAASLLDDDQDLLNGAPLLLAGYGVSSLRAPDSDMGILRFGKTRVRNLFRGGVFRGLFTIHNDGSAPCSGDSGGPAFVRRGGQWLVAGLTHGANAGLNPEIVGAEDPCRAGAGTYTSVAAHGAWIQSHVEGLNGRFLPPTPRPDRFVDFGSYCRSPSLDAEEAYTLQRIFDQLRRFRCEDIESFIASQAPLTLKLGRSDVTDLRPLTWFSGLQSLELDNLPPLDLAPLQGLRHLQSLTLRNTEIRNPQALGSLPALQNLDVSVDISSSTPYSPLDLASLSALPQLEILITDNREITALGSLQRAASTLREVSLVGSRISQLDFLGTAPSLVNINVTRNQISDLSPLAALTSLKRILAGNNRVTTLAPLASLSQLEALVVSHNPLAEGVTCPVAESAPGEICLF